MAKKSRRIELPFTYRPKAVTRQAVLAAVSAATSVGTEKSALPDLAKLQARLIRQRAVKAAQMRRYRENLKKRGGK